MSVLIKGMEMPRACQVCPLSHWNKLDQLTGCELIRRYVPKDDEDFWNNDRPSWCPLVELPPHGRLIDADALFEKVYEFYGEDCETAENWMMGKINDAKTIIEAEKGEQE